MLAGTGALLATDRRIERHLPGGNVDIYGNMSNVALGGRLLLSHLPGAMA